MDEHMDSAQRLILTLSGAILLWALSHSHPSHAELTGIPIWTEHDDAQGKEILVPKGSCRSDLYPDTDFDCFLEAGMVLHPHQPCRFGHPFAFAWGLPLDPNHHGERDLQAISGIGPATAKAIVQYRQENGPFDDITELDAVKGIGPATLLKLTPYFRIQPASDFSACPSASNHMR